MNASIHCSPSLKTPSHPLTRQPSLHLLPTPTKGRGVFTSAPIPARTVLEICPVLVLAPEEVESGIEGTRVWDYGFVWPVGRRLRMVYGEDGEGDGGGVGSKDDNLKERHVTVQSLAIPLGLGALFNHSNDFGAGGGKGRCNVGWVRNIAPSTLSPPASRSSSPVRSPSHPSYIGVHRGRNRNDDSDRSRDETNKTKQQITALDSITYTTLRDIDAGEELCISYGTGGRLGFVDVEAGTRNHLHREDGDEAELNGDESGHAGAGLDEDEKVFRGIVGSDFLEDDGKDER